MDRRGFFISHAGADELWAQWIGQQLVGAGFSVELDVWDWQAGTNVVGAMARALERADRVLAVYSHAYFAGRYSQAEHVGAFASGIEGRIVPVRVDDCTVPGLYASLKRIELADTDESTARERLLSAISGPVGRPIGPVGFPGQPQVAMAAGDAEFPHRLPAVWSVPPRNPFFTGRDVLLTSLNDRLHRRGRDGAGSVAVVPLQGMGGVGKTQLAIEYAHRHASDYGVVWWISADDPVVASAGLVRLAAALSLPAEGPATEVLRVLWAKLAARDDWLLIYDNVDDPSSVAGLRPPQNGQLVLTSRDPAAGRMADLVEIAEFDRAESVALLRRRCPALTEVQAGEVSAAVGDLPLAVEQAGCFLFDTGLGVADYLCLLTAQPEQAGLSDPTIEQHPGLVAVVAASRERLHVASPLAAHLLDQLAFCAPEPLPLTPTPGSGVSAEPGRFGVQFGDIATTATVVRHIARLGLARHTGTVLHAHRLVHGLLRARLSSTEQVHGRRSARRLIATASPGDPDDPAAWPAYAALTPHVQALAGSARDDPADPDDVPEPFCALLLAVTRYLWVSGQNPAGRQLADAAHRYWTRALGTDHPDTLAAANSLALCLWSLGDPDSARVLEEDTLARRRRVFGDDHLDTLRSASNLAVCLRLSGDLDGARLLEEDTLARRRRVLGPDHLDTLRSAHNLAGCLWSLGDPQVARALFDDLRVRYRRVLDDRFHHPRSTHLSAAEPRPLGETATPRNLFEDTLARRRRALGIDHPDTLTSAHDFALCLSVADGPDAARALFEDTLVRRRQALGDAHPDTQATARQLAALACLEN
ncbi:FxSxx-COOH system tetratricopeptide repeat protein [Pseudofrankia saprophytica]|uniref:FxSxx-COOH system tetratricopeptide repeat protein n=1 Tax=Pseudofrankia saprophytica TaxID=298655 RepID=UPI000234BCB1|nr:FxSxx-COOH system tetratricopeptide repeat protein [Pseudofrankia saprophytica]